MSEIPPATRVPVKVGAEYDLKIETIGQSGAGDGIAKVEGYTVIVKGAKEINKKVRVKITACLRRYAFAELV